MEKDSNGIEKNYAEYIEILNKLLSVCDFVLIGSMGLKYAYSNIINIEPNDMDIVISDQSDLYSVTEFFICNGYTVYSWNEVVDKNFDYERMKGRIYFRALREDYQIDVNYCLENITYSEISENVMIINDIKIPTKELFIKLLSFVDKPRNRIIIELLKNVD